MGLQNRKCITLSYTESVQSCSNKGGLWGKREKSPRPAAVKSTTRLFAEDCLLYRTPVRIRIRIGPQHPLASRKRRLNGDLWGSGLEQVLHIFMCVVRGDWMGGPSDKTGKTKVPCHNRCGTMKIFPCLKTLSTEHRSKFRSPPPAMVTFKYRCKILERDVKP
jgi:hypothetical protein